MKTRPPKVSCVGRSCAWLGAGTVAVGIGAALATGSAVAWADDGGQSGRGGHPVGSTRAPDSRTARPATPVKTVEARRSPVAQTTGAAGGETSAAGDRPSHGATAGSAAGTSYSRLGPIGLRGEAPIRPDAVGGLPTGVSRVSPGGPQPQLAAAAALETPASAVTADPSWEMYSSLNGAQIVPGAAVHAALGQIATASDILRAGTWGSGDILGGLTSVVPQVFLAQANWALSRWQKSIEGAKATVLETAGVPVLHQLAQFSLLSTLLLPTASGFALGGAALTVPLVGIFGSAEAASTAEQLVAAARQNGQVYAVVPIVMNKTSSTPNLVNEIGHISVNKGPRSPVVFDTGSSGLSITMPYVGQDNLGPSTGRGEGSYGTGPNAVHYEYDKHTTTVSFGRGIVTGPTTVNIVTTQTATGFDNYQFPDGIVGVLGIGANAYQGPNLNVTLPGELKDGVLMFQFGRLGLLVFGPNPLPALGSVPGAPAAYVQVQIDNGPKNPAKGLFDSGGINGELPASLLGTGQTSGNVPTGTRISVYTADGNTLLYSYTTTASNTPEVTASDIFNTGNAPFQLGPVYFDYSQPDGIGTTVFSYF